MRPGLAGDGASEERLARSGRTVQQNASVGFYAEAVVEGGVGDRKFDCLPDQGYGLVHAADVLVARLGDVAGAGRGPARRRGRAAEVPGEALDQALAAVLRWFALAGLFGGVAGALLCHGPAGSGTGAPVAPALVAVGVYGLGQAGDGLGGGVEIEQRAVDAGAEVGEDAVGDRLPVHPEDAVVCGLADGVPGVSGGMVVVVDVDLPTTEKLLALQALRGTPLALRGPGALFPEEAPQPLAQLRGGNLLAVDGVARRLAAQQVHQAL